MCSASVCGKNHLQNNPTALLINSGNANSGTGEKGLENTIKACEMLANELNIKTERIIPFSTGVIGQQLDLSNFESGIPKAVSQLSDSAINDVSKGILTTDLVEKTTQYHLKWMEKQYHLQV